MDKSVNDALKKTIEGRAQALGFDRVGFCRAEPPTNFDALLRWVEAGRHGTMSYMERQLDLRKDPQSLLAGARTVIALSMNYYQPREHSPDAPKIARYALGRDYHKVLRSRLRSLVRSLTAEHPNEKWRICVDSAPILERDYAQQAGLGWIGKNTMLIDSHRGSWFFIGVVLSTLEIEPDTPAIGGCGTCTKCIDACPTQAIVKSGDRWQIDARRCISYITIEHRGPFNEEQSKMVGDWTFGCDVCQEVCPFNAPRSGHPQRAVQTNVQDFLKPRDWPTLETLTKMDREQWDALTQGSAVRRAGHDGLARNAAANLKNH